MAITFLEILAARDRIADVVRRTPLLTPVGEAAADAPVLHFKCENLQRGGAFKLRGAYNKIAALDPDVRSRGVVAFSSGNHARAVATAATLLKLSAKIVMPEDAPPAKLAATKALGAEIVLYDRYSDDRVAIAAEIAASEGRTLVPPFDDPLIIAGQGTAGLELAEQAEQLDAVVTPIGGGGLAAGLAVAMRHLRPETQLFGAETERSNDAWQSLQKGERVRIEVPRTLADGMQTTLLGELTFPLIKAHYADIVLVSEQDVVEAMRFAADNLSLVIEPTAAVAVAAARRLAADGRARSIAALITGGNIDAVQYGKLLADGVPEQLR